jgi:uncharacterized membrane protein (DUF4010 family)
MEERELLVRLAVAALGGLAVGIEREWSAKRDEPATRFGGVRTFLLLGLLGGLGGQWIATDVALAAGVLGAAALLLAVAYLATAWRGTVDATTEVAGVVVLAAGALAGDGRLTVASAVFAGTALVLVEKSRMHAAVAKLQSYELEAAARFAVLALVVLPLVPSEPMGWLGDLSPRQLWGIVLLFAGLSFAGYLALRLAGARRGYGWAGLLGGLVSSTAVTISFARESRERPETAPALAGGVLAAAAVLPVRVTVLSAVLHLDLARALVPVLALPIVLGAVAVARVHFAAAADGEVGEELLPRNPLRLLAAIQMTVFFAAVLAVLAVIRDRFGSSGLISGAAILGLTDLDALTYSMNRLAATGTPLATAVRALLVGLVANSLFKLAAAATLGDARFRRLAGLGLAIYALAFAAGLLFAGVR